MLAEAATAPLIAPLEVVKANNGTKTVVAKAVKATKTAQKPKTEFPKTLEEYDNWKPMDGYNYEWVNGKLLKIDKMKEDELFIVDNLQRLFIMTQAFANGDTLMPQVRSKTIENQKRIPDIAYFTHAQKLQMAKGQSATPQFAIEIISSANNADEMVNKLSEYFDSGVEVLWYIHPKHKIVLVYDSLTTYQLCRGDMLCSAEKVIEGFKISVADVFKAA
jgi:Uma2 family endonuclease